MASPVDICNRALTYIGDPGNVASIDPPEASTQGRYCARLFPVARDELLEAHTWRFNTRRRALTSVPLPKTVEGEWAFAYALPADCMRPFAVYVPGVTEVGRTEDFAIELGENGAQVVYANVEGAHLKYVIRVADTSVYPPSVVDALAYLLASKLASPLTRSGELIGSMVTLYQRAFAHASALDAGAQSTEEWREEKAPGWVSGR